MISVVIEGSLYLMMLFHDNAKLIMMMMSREEEGLVGPWVAVGGSYPGSLAGWLRLDFPALMMINDSSIFMHYLCFHFKDFLTFS